MDATLAFIQALFPLIPPLDKAGDGCCAPCQAGTERPSFHHLPEVSVVRCVLEVPPPYPLYICRCTQDTQTTQNVNPTCARKCSIPYPDVSCPPHGFASRRSCFRGRYIWMRRPAEQRAAQPTSISTLATSTAGWPGKRALRGGMRLGGEIPPGENTRQL